MSWNIIITSEMRDLGLTGNELLVYAVIAGYSANGQGCYYGSISYLAELVGVHYNTAQGILKNLTKRGFLCKEEHLISGVKFCHYKVKITGSEIVEGPQNLGTPSTKIGDNNKKDNIPPVSLYDKSYNATTPHGGSSHSSVLQKFIEAGCSDADLHDWKAARKSKPITEAVYAAMTREAAKAGITLAEAVRICAENSWQGFRAEYVARFKTQRPQAQQSTFMADLKRTADKLAGRWEGRAQQ